MSPISAQVSMYPLRQPEIDPVIDEVIALLRQPGLDVEPGAMSTVVIGESQQVFAALHTAFEHTRVHGEVVMVVTFSNACPICRPPHEATERER